MSKLSERIRKQGRTDASPMGFLRAPFAPAAPTLLLLLRRESKDGAIPIEADGLIIAGPVPSPAPAGLWGYAAGAQALPAEGAGADFVIVGPNADGSALATSADLVVEVDETWPDSTLRSIDQFAPEAVYLRHGGAITMERLLAIRRIRSLAGPILLEVDSEPETDALRLLREAGVVGIVLTNDAPLKAVRKRIDALPPRKRKREEHASPVLPAAARHSPSGDDEEDDDEIARDILRRNAQYCPLRNC